MGAGDAGPERSLTLPAEPTSPAAARDLVRDVVTAAGRDDWLDTAELAVTELVTNAVLHAHTRLTVTVRVSDDELYVDVLDRSSALPVARGHDRRSTTGRGLAMVSVLATACGVVSLGAEGKRVWFTLAGTASGTDRDEDGDDDLLAAWDEGTWDEPAGQAPRRRDAPERVVRLLGMPANLWLAARQHHDALLRELVLYLADHPVPHADLAAADSARADVTGALLTELDRAAGVLAWVSPPLDLDVRVSPAAAPGYAALGEVLDLAESLAIDGRLLEPPGLPEVVALLAWVLGEVQRQLSGALPKAWEGAAQPRFETEVRPRAGEDEESWDLDLVTRSPRGAVAANEYNRVVAVSRSLAAALGWQVEDLVGRRAVTLVPHELREAHVAGFSRHLSTGEAHIIGRRLTLPVLCADGTRLSCRFLLEEASTGHGRRVYVAWIDPVAASG